MEKKKYYFEKNMLEQILMYLCDGTFNRVGKSELAKILSHFSAGNLRNRLSLALEADLSSQISVFSDKKEVAALQSIRLSQRKLIPKTDNICLHNSLWHRASLSLPDLPEGYSSKSRTHYFGLKNCQFEPTKMPQDTNDVQICAAMYIN